MIEIEISGLDGGGLIKAARGAFSTITQRSEIKKKWMAGALGRCGTHKLAWKKCYKKHWCHLMGRTKGALSMHTHTTEIWCLSHGSICNFCVRFYCDLKYKKYSLTFVIKNIT